MRRFIPFLILLICTSQAVAQKYVGVELVNLSAVRHLSFEQYHTIDKAQSSFANGLFFESQDKRFRYKTTFRFEAYNFDEDENDGLYTVDGVYRGGELQIGFYNRIKQQAIQAHCGLALSGRSGLSDVTITSWGVHGGPGDLEPFYSSQVNLKIEAGLIFRFSDRFHSSIWLEAQTGKQVQDRDEFYLRWYGPTNGLLLVSLSSKFPFREQIN